MCDQEPDSLHPSLSVPSPPPVLQPCHRYSILVQSRPSPRFSLLDDTVVLLSNQPFHFCTPLRSRLSVPIPASPPLPSPLPPAPSLDACLLPPDPPPVSPSPALTWEVRGVGGWMTHSVMMQFHNTQLHSPTDRGTDGRQPLAPGSWPALQPQSLAPKSPPPTPLPSQLKERTEKREE